MTLSLYCCVHIDSHSFQCQACGAISDLITTTEEDEAVDDDLRAQVSQICVAAPAAGSGPATSSAAVDGASGSAAKVPTTPASPAVAPGQAVATPTAVSPAGSPIKSTRSMPATPTTPIVPAAQSVQATPHVAPSPETPHVAPSPETVSSGHASPQTPYYELTPAKGATSSPVVTAGTTPSSSGATGTPVTSATVTAGTTPSSSGATGTPVNSATATAPEDEQSSIKEIQTQVSSLGREEDAELCTGTEPQVAEPAPAPAPAPAVAAPVPANKPTTDYIDALYVVCMAVVAFLIAYLLARKHLHSLLER